MSIEEFERVVKEELERFVKNWHEENKNSPEGYPLEMAGEGEWWENFYAFEG